jgi:hypothetical protein
VADPIKYQKSLALPEQSIPVTPTTPLPVAVISGGGGGGPVTIANGADTTEGTIGDTQATGTVVGFLKSLFVNFFSVPVAIAVDGQTASGAAVANPPVTTGGRAATTNPAGVADGQVVNAMLTKTGKVVTVDGAPRELKKSQKTSISNSTAETTIVTAGAAGVFNDLYGLIFANSGASTTKVDIRDATAGTIIATFEVPTLETRGFMVPAGSGFSQTTAANNWTAQCATATTALEVTALFVQST